MPETFDERRTRLVNQMATARAAQAEKRKHAHVCPSNDLDMAYSKLMKRMAKYAPNNAAMLPITTSLDGGIWYVDLHVHLKGVIEYGIEATGDTLCDALTNASKRLSRQSDIRNEANHERTLFDLTF